MKYNKYETIGRLIKYHRTMLYRKTKSYRYTQRGIIIFRCKYKNKACSCCDIKCRANNKICSNATLVKIEKGQVVRNEDIYINIITNLGFGFHSSVKLDNIILQASKNRSKDNVDVLIASLQKQNSFYYQDLLELLVVNNKEYNHQAKKNCFDNAIKGMINKKYSIDKL